MEPMLRKALRKYNGLRQQVDNVLLGKDGDVWEAELKNWLAKRPCWVVPAKHPIIDAIISGKAELWLYDGQEHGIVGGRVILKHLIDTELFASCVDTNALKAIQAEGLDFFLKYFAGKLVFGWGGVHNNRVPYLIAESGEVVLGRNWLDNYWYENHPALRTSE